MIVRTIMKDVHVTCVSHHACSTCVFCHLCFVSLSLRSRISVPGYPSPIPLTSCPPAVAAAAADAAPVGSDIAALLPSDDADDEHWRPVPAMESHDYVMKIVPTVYEDIAGNKVVSYQYTYAYKVRECIPRRAMGSILVGRRRRKHYAVRDVFSRTYALHALSSSIMCRLFVLRRLLGACNSLMGTVK